jgi:hypothetical protein
MLLFLARLRQAELDETRLCETRRRLSHEVDRRTRSMRWRSTPPISSRLCVPKIRFCNIDGEGRQGQVVRRRRRGAQSRDGEGRPCSEIDGSSTHYNRRHIRIAPNFRAVLAPHVAFQFVDRRSHCLRCAGAASEQRRPAESEEARPVEPEPKKSEIIRVSVLNTVYKLHTNLAMPISSHRCDAILLVRVCRVTNRMPSRRILRRQPNLGNSPWMQGGRVDPGIFTPSPSQIRT